MRPQPLQIVGEDSVGAELTLDAHRRRDVGEPEKVVQVGEREHELAEHSVGAVDQREALLLGEGHRREPALGERLAGRLQRAVGRADLALTHDGQRDVGKRREVAGTPEAAVLVDDRRQPGRQQIGIGLRCLGADAGAAGGERRQP